jgi:hypothetical protein
MGNKYIIKILTVTPKSYIAFVDESLDPLERFLEEKEIPRNFVFWVKKPLEWQTRPKYYFWPLQGPIL